MPDLAVATCHRSDITRGLEQRYPHLEKHTALHAVSQAVRALANTGLDDAKDADRLVAAVAEHRVRLRLAPDGMDGRSDPRAAAGRRALTPPPSNP